MTTRLDLINSMLATTGTARLAAADENHPNYITADAILSDVIEEFSSKALWFNTTYRTLVPNSENKIVVPSNALTCDPADASKDYAIRGQYLFDNGNYTFIIPEAVACVIVAELELTDMPPAAIQFIRARARMMYYGDQDGSGTKLQMYAQFYQEKELELLTLNMKNTDANFFAGKGYANFATRRASTANPITRII